MKSLPEIAFNCNYKYSISHLLKHTCVSVAAVSVV